MEKFEYDHIPVENRAIVSDISIGEDKNLYNKENYWSSKRVDDINYIFIYSDEKDLIYFFEF